MLWDLHYHMVKYGMKAAQLGYDDDGRHLAELGNIDVAGDKMAGRYLDIGRLFLSASGS